MDRCAAAAISSSGRSPADRPPTSAPARGSQPVDARTRATLAQAARRRITRVVEALDAPLLAAARAPEHRAAACSASLRTNDHARRRRRRNRVHGAALRDDLAARARRSPSGRDAGARRPRRRNAPRCESRDHASGACTLRSQSCAATSSLPLARSISASRCGAIGLLRRSCVTSAIQRAVGRVARRHVIQRRASVSVRKRLVRRSSATSCVRVVEALVRGRIEGEGDLAPVGRDVVVLAPGSARASS